MLSLRKLYASLVICLLVDAFFYQRVLRAADNEVINSLPNQNNSFMSNARTFWQNELPDVLGRYFPLGWVHSGGTFTAAQTSGVNSPAFSVEAFTSSGNRVTATGVGSPATGSGGSASISFNSTVGCAATDIAWVIVSAASDNTLSQFQRSGTSNYFVDCVSTTQPSLPSDSAWLMNVTISSSSITSVADRRDSFSFAQRNIFNTSDTLWNISATSADNTAALQALIDRIPGSVQTTPTTGDGGVIEFAPGTYTFAGTVNLDNKRGVTLRCGGNHGRGTINRPPCILQYSGAGAGNFIRFNSAHMLTIEGFQIEPTNTLYTGDLLSGQHSSAAVDIVQLRIYNNWIGPATATVVPRSLLRVKQIIDSEIASNQFIRGARHIILGDPEYAIQVSVHHNIFNNSSIMSIVHSAGESIHIYENTFEPGAAGESRAISQNTANFCLGCTYERNWFGDASPGAFYWMDLRVLGGSITGNRAVVPTSGFFLRLQSSQGVLVAGNQVGGQVFMEFLAGNSGIIVHGNDITGVTTAYVDAQLVSTDSYLQSGPDVNARMPIRTSALSFRGLHNLPSAGALDRLIIGRFTTTPSNLPLHGLGILDDQNDGLHLYSRSDGNTGEVAVHTAQSPNTILTKRVRVPGDGGIQWLTGTRPSCDVAHRGTIFYVAGATGVLDTAEICRKDAADAYAWASLF